MMCSRSFLLSVAALVGAAMLGVANPAHADFRATFSTTAGSATVIDGGAGDTDGMVNNSITVNYSDSAYNLIGTISFTNSPGAPTFAILDVSYNIRTFNPMTGVPTTGGAASLVVSSTGFTQPTPNPLTMTSTVNGNGAGVGTITFQQYADTNNGQATTSGASVSSPGQQGPFNIAQTGGFGSAASVTFNKGAGAYSITDVLLFNLNPNSNTSGDSQSRVTSAAVPAPPTLLLAFAALPTWGIGSWLRRRRTQV